MGETINSFTVSVVSHGHQAQLSRLLPQLAKLCSAQLHKVVVTHNTQEQLDSELLLRVRNFPFEVDFVTNDRPLGFGANHNNAFIACKSDYFCALNPDIELLDNPFVAMANSLNKNDVGLSYPGQIDSNAAPLDFERAVVSPYALVARHWHAMLRKLGASTTIASGQPVNWASGSFLAFKSTTFKTLGGFDERYFMYCEDVDICLRAQLLGYRMERADAVVVHHTQRRTLKSVRHLAWHMRSLFRLWRSTSYREYKKQFMGVNN